MSDKLPEWPDRIECRTEVDYYANLAEAALARMEALVEVVRDLRRVARGERDDEVELDREVDELLAACERGK